MTCRWHNINFPWANISWPWYDMFEIADRLVLINAFVRFWPPAKYGRPEVFSREKCTFPTSKFRELQLRLIKMQTPQRKLKVESSLLTDSTEKSLTETTKISMILKRTVDERLRNSTSPGARCWIWQIKN